MLHLKIILEISSKGEFVATAWFLATSRVKQCYNIIFDEIFELDIVTNNQIYREFKYLSTIRLFNKNVQLYKK